MSDLKQTVRQSIDHIFASHTDIFHEYEELILCNGQWGAAGFASPAPDYVKRGTLVRNSLKDTTWVETGTLFGDTTRILANISKHVYTIEPDVTLYNGAFDKLSTLKNVTVLNGTSEVILPDVASKISGNVCFFLDGHHSGAGTFAGPSDTPILDELNVIRKNIPRYDRVLIAIDDIRLFTGKRHIYGDYPSLDFLVDFARSNSLRWKIEHDIFFADNEL